MTHHLLQTQIWGIRILTKVNLKNNLVNKNFQIRALQMFSAPGPQSLKSPLIYIHLKNIFFFELQNFFPRNSCKLYTEISPLENCPPPRKTAPYPNPNPGRICGGNPPRCNFTRGNFPVTHSNGLWPTTKDTSYHKSAKYL